MPTLTELIKESLEGKLSDQIRASLETEDELKESLNDSELKTIHKKCKDIIEFCNKYETKKSLFGSMKHNITWFINELIYDVYFKFEDIIPYIPTCEFDLKCISNSDDYNASNMSRHLKDSVNRINTIHKAINGLFGECVKVLPKSNIDTFDIDYRDATRMRIDLKKSNPNIAAVFNKKGIDSSKLQIDDNYIYVPIS